MISHKSVYDVLRYNVDKLWSDGLFMSCLQGIDQQSQHGNVIQTVEPDGMTMLTETMDDKNQSINTGNIKKTTLIPNKEKPDTYKKGTTVLKSPGVFDPELIQNRLSMTIQSYNLSPGKKETRSVVSDDSRTPSEKIRDRRKLADKEVIKLKRRSEMENLHNSKVACQHKSLTTSSSSLTCDNVSNVTSTCLEDRNQNNDAMSIASAPNYDKARQPIMLYKVKRRNTGSSWSCPTTDDMSEYMAIPDIGSRATLDSGAYVERVDEKRAVADEIIQEPFVQSERGEKQNLIKRAQQWLSDYQYECISSDDISDIDAFQTQDGTSDVGSTTSTQDNFCIEMLQKYNLPDKSMRETPTNEKEIKENAYGKEDKYIQQNTVNLQLWSSTESLNTEDLLDEHQYITLDGITGSSEMLQAPTPAEFYASAVQAAVQATVQAAVNISSSHDDKQSCNEEPVDKQEKNNVIMQTDERQTQHKECVTQDKEPRCRRNDELSNGLNKSQKHTIKPAKTVTGEELTKILAENVVQHVVDCVVPRYEQHPIPIQTNNNNVGGLKVQQTTLRRKMCQCQGSQRGGASAVDITQPLRGRSPSLSKHIEWKEPKRHFGHPSSPILRHECASPSRYSTPVQHIASPPRTTVHLHTRSHDPCVSSQITTTSKRVRHQEKGR